MEFKTRFNKGDTIYFMHDDVPSKDEIVGIEVFYGQKISINGNNRVHVSCTDPQVTYYVGSCESGIVQENAYSRKEELIQMLCDKLE